MFRIATSAAAAGFIVAACASPGNAPFEPHAAAVAAQFTRAAYRVVYSFGQRAKSDDGVRPLAALHAIDGTLYGTTQEGGISTRHCTFGCGTVFRVAPSGAESIVYRFTGGIDGVAPSSRLVTLNGALAGTTNGGGSGTACYAGCGTVFRVDTDGKAPKILYAFKGGRDGAAPLGGLTVVGAALYGTTEYGGTRKGDCFNGCGTVFRLDSNGKNERIVHRFTGGSDGANPLDTLLEINGSLYGTTSYGGKATPLCVHGCGTVFRIDPNGKETILYRFEYALKSSDAAFPVAGLLFSKGLFYGTSLGGGSAALGTVFVLDPASGKERVLHSFACCGPGDGASPAAPLVEIGNAFYGTTRGGGERGHGTIFEIDRAGKERIVYRFEGRPDGTQPNGSLLLAGTTLFGTTAWGGKTSEGSVFSLTP